MSGALVQPPSGSGPALNFSARRLTSALVYRLYSAEPECLSPPTGNDGQPSLPNCSHYQHPYLSPSLFQWRGGWERKRMKALRHLCSSVRQAAELTRADASQLKQAGGSGLTCCSADLGLATSRAASCARAAAPRGVDAVPLQRCNALHTKHKHSQVVSSTR